MESAEPNNPIRNKRIECVRKQASATVRSGKSYSALTSGRAGVASARARFPDVSSVSSKEERAPPAREDRLPIHGLRQGWVNPSTPHDAGDRFAIPKRWCFQPPLISQLCGDSTHGAAANGGAQMDFAGPRQIGSTGPASLLRRHAAAELIFCSWKKCNTLSRSVNKKPRNILGCVRGSCRLSTRTEQGRARRAVPS
jgi:hypothetical protein